MAKNLSKVFAPTRADVLEARTQAGHTQHQAAQSLYVEDRTWQRWEAGASGMSPGYWELYLLKAGITQLPG